MPKYIDIDTKPFTKPMLRYFRAELEKAGSADELMIEKEALKHCSGASVMITHKDVEAYKEKYLTGVYEPLREHYNAEIPYVFWSRMYEMLKRVNPHIQ